MELARVIAGIREARFSRGVACPRCGADGCIRWGIGRGRQRYRCRGCRRTFNDLTGTPAAYAKKLHLWPLYGTCLDAGVTVRVAAQRTGVHRTTSFRWRHKRLTGLRERDGDLVTGWVEIVAAWFAHSEKGARDLERAPRLHGFVEPWPSARLGVNVVIAADRLGNVVTGTSGRANARQPSVAELWSATRDRIVGRPILTAAEGPLGPTATVAQRLDGEFHDTRPYRPDPQAHLATLRIAVDYRARLLGWMVRFRGVSTKYLPNYLIWHRGVDRHIRHTVGADSLRWPLASGFG